jgi:dihydrofolate reductase
LTRVHATPKGDTSFPEFDPDDWRALTREHQPAGPRDDFETTFTTLERLQN